MRSSAVIHLATAVSFMLVALACTSGPVEAIDEALDAGEDTDTNEVIDAEPDGVPPFPPCAFTEDEFRTAVFGDQGPILVTNMDGRQQLQGTVSQVGPGEWQFHEGSESTPIEIMFRPPADVSLIVPDRDGMAEISRYFMEYGDVSLYEFTQLQVEGVSHLQGGDLFALDFEGHAVTPEPLFDVTRTRPTDAACAMLHRAPHGANRSGECWITYVPMEIALRTEPTVWVRDGEAQVVEWSGRRYHVVVASYRVTWERTCPDYPVDEPDRQLDFDYESHIGFAVLIE